MNEEQRINVTPTKKYFYMVPNLYDDMGLSVYEYRLMLHYLRRGTCTESVRTTAENCKMNKETVINARKRLEEKNLIVITKQSNGTTIDVVDIWQRNINYYCTELGNGNGKCTESGNASVRNQGNKEDLIKNTNTEDSEKASESSRQNNNLSVAFFLEQFSAKRLNNAQIQTLVGLEEKYGLQETKNWITWAARKSMPISRAIPAIHSGMEKKQPTKIKQKTTTEGSGFF